MQLSKKELSIIKHASDHTLKDTLEFLESGSMTNKYNITWVPVLPEGVTLEDYKSIYKTEIYKELNRRKNNEAK